ncbi:MAG: iron-containing redox enzyme family protein [Polyangiales bacterium]
MNELVHDLALAPQPEFGCLPRRAKSCTPSELFLTLFSNLEEKVEYVEAGYHFALRSLTEADSAAVQCAAVCHDDGEFLRTLRSQVANRHDATRDAADDTAWAIAVAKAFAPSGLSDGAWLRGTMLANAVENEVSMRLLRQLMARFGGPGVQEGYAPRYADLLRSVGASPSAALRPGRRACAGPSYEHALLGVCLGLFPTTLRAEIVGFNLWMSMVGPCPLLEQLAPTLAQRDASLRYLTMHDREEMSRLSREAVTELVREAGRDSARVALRARVARGFVAAERSYGRWEAHARSLAGDETRARMGEVAAVAPLVDAYAPPQEREAVEAFAFERYGSLDNKSLYHAFVNVDLHPASRLVAKEYAGAVFEKIDEIFAEDARLNSQHPPAYAERVIAEIVAEQHDKNVRSRGRPSTSMASSEMEEAVKGIQEVFDGCWLQGFADIERAEFEEYGWLFRIYASEHGDGDFAWNHCQIFRKAFLELGDDVMLPKTDRRLYDLFEIGFAAMVTMSVSLNTRTFMPEILGINLGIESTGVGGSYMEQWKSAEQGGNPWRALAWRLHNSIDNYADGHTKWALSAVQAFMKRVKDGAPDVADAQWRRIWRLWRARDILVHGTLDEQAAIDSYFMPPDADPPEPAPATARA